MDARARLDKGAGNAPLAPDQAKSRDGDDTARAFIAQSSSGAVLRRFSACVAES